MKDKTNFIPWMKNNKAWVAGCIGIIALALVSVIYTGSKNSMADRDAASKEQNYVEVENDTEYPGIIHSFAEEPGCDPVLEKELVIEIDGDKIYPSSTDRIDEREAGDWVFFRYMLEETYEAYNGYKEVYPALFRYRKGDYTAERVDQCACYTYDIVGDSLYYLESTKAFQDHGILYVSRLDGTEESILEKELHDFQIVDGRYIYYTYRHDTIGVGLEGHALHRMNLDGSERMIVAYEVSGIDMGTSHFDYRVEDGWVDCGTFKMKIGEPTDGYEEIVFKDIGDNEYIYYVTNRLMKARKDGSERVELDGEDDYHYEIERIEGDWIYYIKGGKPYRIRTDGSEKEAVAHG